MHSITRSVSHVEAPLPPPSAFPPPALPVASMSPIREVPLGLPLSPKADSPIRYAEIVSELRNITEERDLLSAALRQASLETQTLHLTIKEYESRLRESEGNHAVTLRAGQESMAEARDTCERRMVDLSMELSECRKLMHEERESHLARMKAREAEHVAALQAERQLGAERLSQMTIDTKDAVSIVQEQIHDMNTLLEAERKTAREANDKMIQAQKEAAQAQDDLIAERNQHTKALDAFKIREAQKNSTISSLEEQLEAELQEVKRQRQLVVEADAQKADITTALQKEVAEKLLANERALKAEHLIQQSAQNVTSSELRTIESQREATLKSRALHEMEQSLQLEKEKRLVIETHLASETAARKMAEERLAREQQQQRQPITMHAITAQQSLNGPFQDFPSVGMPNQPHPSTSSTSLPFCSYRSVSKHSLT
eukprot:TRINITY_DN17717_c1_g1_i1.p1 TRINITY_DN17717_c1_g1~~TRINITY_DN17717_c1_g1_i1.p1  ORF type:complete len:430 (+),score=92.63 TRINITY_DN17717_c1_g1_i1:31-1320(+)